MDFSGEHLILSLKTKFDLEDTEALKGVLLDAIRATGATILDVAEHKFEPQGYSVVVLIGESHASIHTFPEHEALFIDYFTCGGIPTAKFREIILDRLAPYEVVEDITFKRPYRGEE